MPLALSANGTVSTPSHYSTQEAVVAFASYGQIGNVTLSTFRLLVHSKPSLVDLACSMLFVASTGSPAFRYLFGWSGEYDWYLPCLLESRQDC